MGKLYIPNLKEAIEDLEHNWTLVSKEIENLGGYIDYDILPTIDEIKEAVEEPGNILCEKYYGTRSFAEAYDILLSGKSAWPEEFKDSFNNWWTNHQNRKNDNPVAITQRWGVNYDPVSKLVLIGEIASKQDNRCFSYETSDIKWLQHNAGYYKKKGYSSQYYSQILAYEEDKYHRCPRIRLSDLEAKNIAKMVILLQASAPNRKLDRIEPEDAKVEASERNNKAAESFPCFGNQKNAEVKAKVIADAKLLLSKACYMDLTAYNEQHRTQEGGNVLYDKYYPIILDDEGKIIFDRQGVISAVKTIALERGYSQELYETEPIILPDLAGVVTYQELSQIEGTRISQVPADKVQLALKKDKVTGEYIYTHIVNFPNVFNLVEDKYGDVNDFPELFGKIYTKTRSIKAGQGATALVGQCYLYPFIKEWKERTQDTPFASFTAQWKHPDHLQQMFTDCCMATWPELYEGEKVDTSYSSDALERFREFIINNQLDAQLSSDDKTGFDTFSPWYLLYAFFGCFFGPAFKKSEENDRILKYLVMSMLICPCFCVDEIKTFIQLIASGASFTSIFGTFCSLIAGLATSEVFVSDDLSYLVHSDDPTDEADENDDLDINSIEEVF